MSADQPPGMAPLATLNQRFLARLVDTVVLIVIDVLVSVVVYGDDLSSPTDAGSGKQAVATVVTFVVYFLYEGFMTAARGQTLGKRMLKIRAARLVDGEVPGGDGWTRAAVYALPGAFGVVLVGPLFWLLNSLWCLWDKPYRQCLHDKAARTVVVAAV
ncbi:RDD family protein [Actinacidiphila alni]|uniref:RDD family protein n=1 Tax=Actinacidiphila alni TaxID=380248 RepID=UPI0033D4E8B9